MRRARALASSLVVALAASTVFALPIAAGADDAKPGAKATLTVNVGSFRSPNGRLGCRIFARAEGFPDKATQLAQAWAPIAGKAASCTFTGLEPGVYAVSVIHDENGNGKLDTNLLGMPTEGYGASNNRTHAMSSPSFDESKLTLPAGATAIAVTLHY
jgi:uncharacterized protein (DUF2141 family)